VAATAAASAARASAPAHSNASRSTPISSMPTSSPPLNYHTSSSFSAPCNSSSPSIGSFVCTSAGGRVDYTHAGTGSHGGAMVMNSKGNVVYLSSVCRR